MSGQGRGRIVLQLFDDSRFGPNRSERTRRNVLFQYRDPEDMPSEETHVNWGQGLWYAVKIRFLKLIKGRIERGLTISLNCKQVWPVAAIEKTQVPRLRKLGTSFSRSISPVGLIEECMIRQKAVNAAYKKIARFHGHR